MSYKIIIDSCGELTEEMKKSGNFRDSFVTDRCWRTSYRR